MIKEDIQHLELSHDATQSLTYSNWKTPYTLSEEEYKEVYWQFAAFAHAHPSRFSLVDTREAQFAVTPELQAWIATEVQAKYPVSPVLEKVAIIISSDLIVNISAEQLIDEVSQGQSFQTQYFDSVDAALTWFGL